ncbi:hypothetical protein [Williamsia deligens]|uniref:SdpI/YhfL family protein n=1 Tax=Williamsia deligens TaxID=321325 RepID=A0ABW3GBK4_9NOCA|nr:hypothetical protein [Williamsia deligens]MCP2195162.1 hypothetical protein [Williamsia deligens]
MTIVGAVLLTIVDVAIVAGWVWSTVRAWRAPWDPDLELAIEASRHRRSGPDDQSRRDAVDWKVRLENRAGYPAFGSAILSGIAVGFSGNAVDAATSHFDTWIIEAALFVVSLAVAFVARLLTAKRIERRLSPSR